MPTVTPTRSAVGVIVAPRRKLARAITFSFEDDKVRRLEAIGDPERLGELEIAVL